MQREFSDTLFTMHAFPKTVFLAVVTFRVSALGDISNVVIKEHMQPYTPLPVLIEKELLRVFRNMPAWKAARKGLAYVPSEVEIPLRFIIRDFAMEIYNVGPQYTDGHYKRLGLKLAIVGAAVVLGILAATETINLY